MPSAVRENSLITLKIDPQRPLFVLSIVTADHQLQTLQLTLKLRFELRQQ